MTDFLWAVEYSLLDLLKYFSFFLVVFNFPIYKKKISVPIYFIFSMLCCLVYFEIRGGDRGFSGIPNICSFLFVILIEKGKRIKGFLYMVLTWLIMDFLPGTVRMLFYDLLEDERYLQGALVGRPLWDKILVLVIPLLYHIIMTYWRNSMGSRRRSSGRRWIISCFMSIVNGSCLATVTIPAAMKDTCII